MIISGLTYPMIYPPQTLSKLNIGDIWDQSFQSELDLLCEKQNDLTQFALKGLQMLKYLSRATATTL